MKKIKKLAIVGSGALGQQIAHIAELSKKFSDILFFDDFSEEKNIGKYQILGKNHEISNAFERGQFDELIVGIGYKHMVARKEIFERFSHLIPFAKVVHPNTDIDPSSKIGRGVVIYSGSIIDKDVKVENNVLLNIGCVISHDSHLKSHSFFSPRTSIAGFVEVEEQCVFGINSTIIDNIKIGKSIQLGAGTVVVKDLEKPGLYVGNPSRFIR